MKKLTIALFGLFLAAGVGVAQEPGPGVKKINVPGVGDVVLVNREQLRFKGHERKFSIPKDEINLAATAVPRPPSTFDHSKGGTLKFPILGNNRLGDCYYAAVAHGAQVFTGNAGTECSFDESELTRRYLVISGGDNGLDDQTIMPEWKSGIVGPGGPRRILDEMTVNQRDDASAQLAAWAFGGLIWTTNLESGWTQNARAGAVWDAGQGRGVGGHAMFLTGKTAGGNWQTQTWAIGPPYIEVTPRGMAESQSELIVVFSLDQFKPDGTSAFTGLHYDDMTALWQSMGGKSLPPSPFPPKPTPPPEPAAGGHHPYLLGGALAVVVLVLLIVVFARYKISPR